MIINPISRKKFIELDYHFVRKKAATRQLITKYVPLHLQIAKVVTKLLPKIAFKEFCVKLGVLLLPLTSLRGHDILSVRCSKIMHKIPPKTTKIMIEYKKKKSTIYYLLTTNNLQIPTI